MGLDDHNYQKKIQHYGQIIIVCTMVRQKLKEMLHIDNKHTPHKCHVFPNERMKQNVAPRTNIYERKADRGKQPCSIKVNKLLIILNLEWK